MVYHIRRVTGIFFGLVIFLHKNIFCDPSLELSHRDGSNEGSQHIFSLRNRKNYLLDPH